MTESPTISLLFHIIYTTGSVESLLPMVGSLLRWSNCRFNLVSNACEPAEIALLQAYCRTSERLSLTVLPVKTQTDHGVALNYLFNLSQEPYFCFMDSDILAAGDFMAELNPLLETSDGLFAGWPLTVRAAERTLPDNYPFIAGRYAVDTRGACLGGTYFTILRRSAVLKTLKTVKRGFERQHWKQLPHSLRRILQSIGRTYHTYDTGRVLFLCMAHQGSRLRFLEIDSLCHIGSYSINVRIVRNHSAQPSHSLNFKTLITRIYRKVMEIIRYQSYRQSMIRKIGQDPVQQAHTKRYRQITNYFMALTTALHHNEPLPEILRMNDPEIDPNIERATRLLAAEWQLWNTSKQV